MMRRRRRRQREDMLVQGNNHLGPLIYQFSIPAFFTCPGATAACLLVCYALRFLFVMNLGKHMRNWARSLHAESFVREMIAEIRRRRVEQLRIHVAGDFYAVAYILAWVAIARACPRVEFLFYSRSWRREELRPALIELASLPNVFAWWSEDRNTGPMDMIVGRRNFLCVEETDEALVPPGVLVFRENKLRKWLRKWINGSWVCAKEQGPAPVLTCSECQFCFKTLPLPTPPEARPAPVPPPGRPKRRPAPRRKLES
jgi:hypothetical protein